MLEESIHAIENAENSTLIWLAILFAMLILFYALRLGAQALAGHFGSDKLQNTSISKLSQALVQTNQELLQTNRELAEDHKETVKQQRETTAAFATLAREVRGVSTTANEHYDLGKITHDNSSAILTKLDVLIAAVDTQHKHARSKDKETTQALQQIQQIQWWLQFRLQTEFPQLALPAPQETSVAVA